LRLIFGEGAKVLTDGQSVVPKRLMDTGFEFEFQTIEETIDNLV
jgi:NAD dependent epimerase/dehydratase family enzyme